MASPTLTSKFFTTSSGTKTHYLQGGDENGTLVICMHGLGGSTNTFSPLAKVLPDTYNVVLVDFQGYGQTPLTSKTEPLTIPGHVSDLHDLVTFLQTDSQGVAKGSKLVVVGHSLGSIVALQYAGKYPGTVSGLALLGVGRSAAHIPAVRQRMLDVAASTRENGIEATAAKSSVGNFPTPEQRAVPPEHIEEVRQAIAASDPEGYARTCEMIVGPTHVDPDYASIKCPAVFVAGDMDVISPVQRSEDISKLLGGPSSIEIVPSGHQPLISATEATTSAILKLLENL
ncbi:Alpha/Beta hydrolase protein [Xylariales sp. PMI_506]|nr:Alpha/Beta hydrolase protein [Xylariales sp. PMI_506]